MNFIEFPPPYSLKNSVLAVWQSIESGSGRAFRVLPDGSFDLILSIPRDSGHSPSWSLVGPMNRFLLSQPEHPVTYRGLRFQPGAAVRLGLFEDDLRQLLNSEVEAHLLLKRNILETFRTLEELSDFRSFASRVFQILIELKRRAHIPLQKQRELRILETHFSETRLALSGAHQSVAAVAEDVGITRQHLTRIVKKHSGYGVKEFERVRRFSLLSDFLYAHPAASLCETALSFGYSDQAHLCHDFKALSGVCLTQWFCERGIKRDVPFLQDTPIETVP